MNLRFLLILSSAVSLWAGCSRHERPAAGEVLPAIRVRTAAVQRETLPLAVETTGTVRAVERAAIAAKVSGTISSLPLVLGQQVRAGEVLLTISAAELTARVAQVRAEIAQVERELARERTLFSTGAGPADAVKTLEDRLALATAAMREAETMVAYTSVRAPFAGTVTRKYVEAGDYASPGAPLLQLDGRSRFEIEVGIPESLAAGLTVGTALEVEPGPGPARVSAPIAELSSAADSAARTITAKLAVPTGTSVRAGQFVRVFLPGAPVTVLLIPGNAVSLFGQMERVFVVGERDRASLRLVKTGATHGNRVEILSGLEPTDRVVLDPSTTLRDGQPLTLAP
ncbi:MAG: efflux RND transporter periplasmic adaptor subunit [Verrucomicrobia bacterium]|nr:efflux RND transporter periplasmic adaptor subunit [Verrucomicrobiota bacterium]